MAETLSIPQTVNRQAIYDSLISQIAALVEGESDLITSFQPLPE